MVPSNMDCFSHSRLEFLMSLLFVSPFSVEVFSGFQRFSKVFLLTYQRTSKIDIKG